MADLLPSRSELHPDEDEQDRPDERTRGRVGDEAPEWHPGDAGRKADEGPHDRQQPAEEHGGIAVSIEEVLGDLDLVRADQQVPSVALKERSTPPPPARVRDKRAERVPDRRGDDDQPEIPWPARERLGLRRIGDEEAREREDELRGQRDHRGLDRHRCGHTDVADRGIERGEERDDDLVDEREHARPLLTGSTKGAIPALAAGREPARPRTPGGGYPRRSGRAAILGSWSTIPKVRITRRTASCRPSPRTRTVRLAQPHRSSSRVPTSPSPTSRLSRVTAGRPSSTCTHATGCRRRATSSSASSRPARWSTASRQGSATWRARRSRRRMPPVCRRTCSGATPRASAAHSPARSC